MPRTRTYPQGIFWIGTVPQESKGTPVTSLPVGCVWIKGQLEEGSTGFVHWQICLAFRKRQRLSACTLLFGEGSHWELTRSAAARDYVWKDETSLGERFEFGVCPINLSSGADWDAIWSSALSGDLGSIPAGIRIRNYSSLRSIGSDFQRPVSVSRRVVVLWGATGTGKSRRAWDEAGEDAYAKCPRTKFWDGYSSERAIVIDEFRGGIDVSHLLRWFDRYPVRVEIKGSTRPFLGESIWITSNIHPREWYPELDEQTFF